MRLELSRQLAWGSLFGPTTDDLDAFVVALAFGWLCLKGRLSRTASQSRLFSKTNTQACIRWGLHKENYLHRGGVLERSCSQRSKATISYYGAGFPSSLIGRAAPRKTVAEVYSIAAAVFKFDPLTLISAFTLRAPFFPATTTIRNDMRSVPGKCHGFLRRLIKAAVSFTTATHLISLVGGTECHGVRRRTEL